jgi:hypothetical protein
VVRTQLFTNGDGILVLQEAAMLRPILFIVILLLLLGALPTWPYSGSWGYYPSAGLGTVLIILLVLYLLGVL